MDIDTLQSRIHGSLALAGIGDALGAPTEQWHIDEIAASYGGLVTRFAEPPPDTFAGALGGRRAEVTDDASQMYHLAHALVAADGRLDHAGWVACLLDWADTSPKAVFMGPSTASVVAALRSGRDPASVGRIGSSARRLSTQGNTNGAAMRVAPCGLLHPGRLDAACELALVTCLPTHDTDAAISAACAIAAACAQALVDDGLQAVIAASLRGAAIGERLALEHARAVPGPRVLTRIEMALAIATEARTDRDFLKAMESRVGNSVLAAESVPAAIGALAYAQGEPLRSVALCASMGNDTDSMATMAGAIAGAMHGLARLPGALWREFRDVNESTYRLETLSRGMAVLAARAAAAAR